MNNDLVGSRVADLGVLSALLAGRSLCVPLVAEGCLCGSTPSRPIATNVPPLSSVLLYGPPGGPASPRWSTSSGPPFLSR